MNFNLSVFGYYLCYWCHTQEIIAKSSAMKLLPYVFFKEFHKLRFYV